ncbi:hypothetical protein [Chryseobacterium jejuense]|uniref:Lipoprotein n=1 Tax=Chryseobacterium jejuense TaxID=445960 RepID=A0A2X2VHB7_CHRJE|nr:hypothetical protein [Chryseobacterium jejuense]SDJ21220.1 hypothetical protein SAMN05421542_3035 [Chryseobacterium jejuense]SQB28556.1 Uncharacterised protein [Chryseobacterium jejuense]
MKKEKLLVLISLISIFYSCKKESKPNKVSPNVAAVDSSTVVADSSAFKRLMTEDNGLMLYSEIKKIKKVSNYAEGPMQSFDFSFKDYTFKIRYIEDRAYIQYKNADKMIQGWKFCNVNFYYDSSWEIAEKDSHFLYNAATSSGILLFPGFTEEYATYFVYEFNNNAIKYVKVVSLNTTLSADLWTNSHEFRAVRKNNELKISLLDKDGKEYFFEDGGEDQENEPKNPNISKDLILLNTADGVK